ncbi:unnamed protein product [Cercospora beticola]|nr:unnamed protein product [Cercospora beticola]
MLQRTPAQPPSSSSSYGDIHATTEGQDLRADDDFTGVDDSEIEIADVPISTNKELWKGSDFTNDIQNAQYAKEDAIKLAEKLEQSVHLSQFTLCAVSTANLPFQLIKPSPAAVKCNGLFRSGSCLARLNRVAAHSADQIECATA